MKKHPSNYGAISSTIMGTAQISEISSHFKDVYDGLVTNISTITSSIKTLDGALRTIGTPRDNQTFRDSIHTTQFTTNKIASLTSKDVIKLKGLIMKGDKQQQLQVEKLETHFREAVTQYYSLQKELANKQKAYLLSSLHLENDVEEKGNLSTQRQAQIARDIAYEQDMLLEKEEQVRRIETDVLDVNEIMRELGSIIHAQGEHIDTIENTIDSAVGNVHEATEQLTIASRYQTRRQRRLLIWFLVVLVIVAIVVAILVTQIH